MWKYREKTYMLQEGFAILATFSDSLLGRLRICPNIIAPSAYRSPTALWNIGAAKTKQCSVCSRRHR